MNKLKSSESKKCTKASDTHTLKKDTNLGENIEKLGIKPKNVNGLVNGVNHMTPGKKDKRNKAKTVGNQSDGIPSTKSSDTSIKTNPSKTPEPTIKEIEDSTPSTSDFSESKSDKSSTVELKGVKSKAKTKRTDSDKSIPSTSSKSDIRNRLDDSDSSDFDITQFIKTKYGDRKDEDLEKEKLLEQIVEKHVPPEPAADATEDVPRVENPDICYIQYESELQMPMIMKIIQKDLSEPYSIYTYRYFIHNWPNLCYLAMCDEECVGAIVCKLDVHRKLIKRGYIAMLAVDKRFRKHGIGSTLVKRAIEEMVKGNADEVVLETEITNKPALRLYEALGFVRDKRLFRYYLNGVDALRLKLWLR